MAIKTSITLNDQMSGALKSIRDSIDKMNESWSKLEEEMNKGLHTEDLDKAETSLQNMGKNTDDLADKMGGLESSSGSALGSIISNLGGVIAKLAIAKKGFDFLKESIEGAFVQTEQETRLDVVLRNRYGKYGDAVQSGIFNTLKQDASDVQSRGVIGDEASLAGYAELATYMSDENALREMNKAMDDFAVGMYGMNITTDQMVNVASNFGRAMNGQFTMLERQGFKITEVQKDIIQNGTDMQKALTMQEVMYEWNGIYEELSNTTEGLLVRVKNAWGDIKEEVGQKLYPVLDKVLSKVLDAMPKIETMIGNVTDALKPLLDILSPIADILGGIIGGVNWLWDNTFGYTETTSTSAESSVPVWLNEGVDMSPAIQRGTPELQEALFALGDYSPTAVKDIHDDVKSISHSLDIATTDLKYIRDVAERDAINRYGANQIIVELGGVTNNVSNNADLDGIVDYIATKTTEALNSAMEGV